MTPTVLLIMCHFFNTGSVDILWCAELRRVACSFITSETKAVVEVQTEGSQVWDNDGTGIFQGLVPAGALFNMSSTVINTIEDS